MDDPEFAETLPMTHKMWAEAEKVYARNRAATAGRTLSDNIDRYNTLTRQLTADNTSAKTKILYNKSGTTLRAATCPTSLVAADKCYWYIAPTRQEALYLEAVLNAEYLQDAWRESKTSRLDYDLNPLKHVPVPAFDSSSPSHARIARLALHAEHNPQADRAELENLVAALLPGWG